MTYELTSMKTFRGMEGRGLNAVISLDGKPVAFVLDEGNGGMLSFDFSNPGQNPKSFEKHRATAAAEEAKFRAFALKWYMESGAYAEFEDEVAKISGKREPTTPNAYNAMEHWVNRQADDLLNKRRLDRAAKTKTLFRIEGDKDDVWRTIAAPYSAPIRAHLDQKYGKRLAAIYGVELGRSS